MGAVKFVTETQLTELKAMRGERIEDGTLAPADKSLAEVLADNKAKKEEEFQAVWTSMKVVCVRHHFFAFPRAAMIDTLRS